VSYSLPITIRETIELNRFLHTPELFVRTVRFPEEPLPLQELENRQKTYLMAVLKQEETQPLKLREAHRGDPNSRLEVLDGDSWLRVQGLIQFFRSGISATHEIFDVLSDARRQASVSMSGTSDKSPIRNEDFTYQRLKDNDAFMHVINSATVRIELEPGF
jgi:hypothetical protein